MITKKQYFYIVSLPRSRSTWFGVFFTTNVSHCFHELLSKHDQNLVQALYHTERPYSGSAETNPLSLFQLKDIPQGPVVLVKRPVEDVERSMLNAFDPIEGLTRPEWELFIHNMIDGYAMVLDFYEEHGKNLLVVNFKDLEDDEVLTKVWRHCIPTYMPDSIYVQRFNGLRISGKMRDLTASIKRSAFNRNVDFKESIQKTLHEYDPAEFRKKFNALIGRIKDREKAKERLKAVDIVVPEPKIVLAHS